MSPLTRSPSIALAIAFAAAGLLATTAEAAPAAPVDAGVARVDVVGQLPLREACPTVDTRDLADDLAPAWEAAAKPSSVEVAFKLQHRHVYDVQPATSSPRVWHEIRHAVHGLRCDGGDERVHAVRFIVYFVDGAQDARLAAITVADANDPADR